MEEQRPAAFFVAASELVVRARYEQALVTRDWLAGEIVAVEALQVGVYLMRGTQVLAVRATPTDSADLRLLGMEDAVAALRCASGRRRRWQSGIREARWRCRRCGRFLRTRRRQ